MEPHDNIRSAQDDALARGMGIRAVAMTGRPYSAEIERQGVDVAHVGKLNVEDVSGRSVQSDLQLLLNAIGGLENELFELQAILEPLLEPGAVPRAEGPSMERSNASTFSLTVLGAIERLMELDARMKAIRQRLDLQPPGSS